jgi:hypothetical protein
MHEITGCRGFVGAAAFARVQLDATSGTTREVQQVPAECQTKLAELTARSYCTIIHSALHAAPLTKNTPSATEQIARATAVGWLRVW